MLSRFTIRFRVIAAVALMLLTSVGLGLFAAGRLNDVDHAADDVANNWLPSSQVLGDLSQDVALYRSRQGQSMQLSDTARADMLKSLEQTRLLVTKDMAAYKPLVSAGAEAELAATLETTIGNYLAYDSRLRGLIESDDIPTASALYFGEMRTSIDAARAAIKADRDFQLTEGTKAAEHGNQLGKSAITMIYAALGGAALIGVVIGWLMVTTISAPVRKMAEAMRRLADGNVDSAIPNLGEKNEIGEMATAVEVFKDGMIRSRVLEAEAAKAREDAVVQRKQTMTDLADQFESAVGDVVEMVSSAATEMQATASQLTSSAHESAAQATSVSAAAEEAGTNVTSVAGSAEELGASVNEIARQVQHSLHKAREAVNEADATAIIVNELSEAAGRINGIVDMIASIASQTNLLALNATIESARAGEAGKGFAVVASEVKQLAGQTSKATSEINTQISAIQATTKRAVEAIVNITATIRDINDSSTTIAAAVDQQGAATNEIVQAVNQASVGTSEVTQNITGVARMAEETGIGAHQVLTASSELAKQAEHLRGQVHDFIAQVRAA